MELIRIQLQVIPNKPIRVRIERELYQLLELNIIEPYNVTVTIENDENSNYNKNLYIVNFYNIKDNNLYTFKFNNEHPFRPPKLDINYKSYSYNYYLSINSPDFKENLLKYYKIRCMCCETKLCSDNWSPAYTMKTILDEVEYFKNINKNMTFRVIVNIIKRKYLIDDINIIEWLC